MTGSVPRRRHEPAPSSTGLQPTVAGALAYLAGPLSGALLIGVERTSRFVKFHAWQALVALGGLGVQQRAVLRDYTKVRAPYDGTITARFADPGALIQVATSSATTAIPLFTIMDLDTVRIYANVPQDDSPWIVPGQTKVAVHVHELPDRSFTGTITRSTLALSSPSSIVSR